MFIWTLHDVIGLGLFALMAVVAIIFVICYYLERAFLAAKRWFRR